MKFPPFGRLLKQIRQSRVPAVRAGQRPVLARNDPLNIFGRQRQQTLLIAAAHCCKKSFTTWTFFSMLIEISPFPLHRVSELIGRSEPSCRAITPHRSITCSSVELDQVLKDQLTPAISARLHKQSTFRKPAKFDRRETEIFRKRTNLRCGAVIVARQEHDSPATMYGRILVKDGSAQMVEALDQSCASEGLRDEGLEEGCPPSSSGGTP
jgi:hypothetical protein